MTMTTRRCRPSSSPPPTRSSSPTSKRTSMISTYLLIALLSLTSLPTPTLARRGALVKDGMSSKSAYENPMLSQSGDISMDPDVLAITSRIPNWSIDPLPKTATTASSSLSKEDCATIKCITQLPLYINFKSKKLPGGKRSNWMRATASLGDPKVNARSRAVRAVWTCTNPNSDPDMKNDANVLEDSYEDCLKRLYGKYVEVEVLLPRATTASGSSGSSGGPPPSVVYRVPIQSGHVNRMGMVSKSRATVTLYPRGRTLAGGDAAKAAGAKKDVAIPLGLTNVHLPLGPGLVDPGWAKGKKLFWKGRSMGLV